MPKKKKIDLSTVNGIRAILTDGIENLYSVPNKDRDVMWTRLNIMGSNSANGLLRTQMMMDEIERRNRKSES